MDTLSLQQRHTIQSPLPAWCSLTFLTPHIGLTKRECVAHIERAAENGMLWKSTSGGGGEGGEEGGDSYGEGRGHEGVPRATVSPLFDAALSTPAAVLLHVRPIHSATLPFPVSEFAWPVPSTDGDRIAYTRRLAVFSHPAYVYSSEYQASNRRVYYRNQRETTHVFPVMFDLSAAGKPAGTWPGAPAKHGEKIFRRMRLHPSSSRSPTRGMVISRMVISGGARMEEEEVALLGLYDGGEREMDVREGAMRYVLPVQEALFQACLHKDGPELTRDKLDRAYPFTFKRSVFRDWFDCKYDRYTKGSSTQPPLFEAKSCKNDDVILAVWRDLHDEYEFDATMIFLKKKDERYELPNGGVSDPIRLLNENTVGGPDQKREAIAHIVYDQLTTTFHRYGDSYRCLPPTAFSTDDSAIACVRRVESTLFVKRHFAVVVYVEGCVLHEMPVGIQLRSVPNSIDRDASALRDRLRDSVHEKAHVCHGRPAQAMSRAMTTSSTSPSPTIPMYVATQFGSNTAFGAIKDFNIFVRGLCSFSSTFLVAGDMVTLQLESAYPSIVNPTEGLPWKYIWKYRLAEKRALKRAYVLMSGILSPNPSPLIGQTRKLQAYMELYHKTLHSQDSQDSQALSCMTEESFQLIAPLYTVCAPAKRRYAKGYPTPPELYGFAKVSFTLDGRMTIQRPCGEACYRERLILEHLCATGCPAYTLDYVGYTLVDQQAERAKYMVSDGSEPALPFATRLLFRRNKGSSPRRDECIVPPPYNPVVKVNTDGTLASGTVYDGAELREQVERDYFEYLFTSSDFTQPDAAESDRVSLLDLMLVHMHYSGNAKNEGIQFATVFRGLLRDVATKERLEDMVRMIQPHLSDDDATSLAERMRGHIRDHYYGPYKTIPGPVVLQKRGWTREIKDLFWYIVSISANDPVTMPVETLEQRVRAYVLGQHILHDTIKPPEISRYIEKALIPSIDQDGSPLKVTLVKIGPNTYYIVFRIKIGFTFTDRVTFWLTIRNVLRVSDEKKAQNILNVDILRRVFQAFLRQCHDEVQSDNSDRHTGESQTKTTYDHRTISKNDIIYATSGAEIPLNAFPEMTIVGPQPQTMPQPEQVSIERVEELHPLLRTRPPSDSLKYRDYVVLVHHIVVQVASALHDLHTTRCVVHNALDEEALLIYHIVEGEEVLLTRPLDALLDEWSSSHPKTPVHQLADTVTVRLTKFENSINFGSVERPAAEVDATQPCGPDKSVLVGPVESTATLEAKRLVIDVERRGEEIEGERTLEAKRLANEEKAAALALLEAAADSLQQRPGIRVRPTVTEMDGGRYDVFLLGVLAHKLLYGADPHFVATDADDKCTESQTAASQRTATRLGNMRLRQRLHFRQSRVGEGTMPFVVLKEHLCLPPQKSYYMHPFLKGALSEYLYYFDIEAALRSLHRIDDPPYIQDPSFFVFGVVPTLTSFKATSRGYGIVSAQEHLEEYRRIGGSPSPRPNANYLHGVAHFSRLDAPAGGKGPNRVYLIGEFHGSQTCGTRDYVSAYEEYLLANENEFKHLIDVFIEVANIAEFQTALHDSFLSVLDEEVVATWRRKESMYAMPLSRDDWDVSRLPGLQLVTGWIYRLRNFLHPCIFPRNTDILHSHSELPARRCRFSNLYSRFHWTDPGYVVSAADPQTVLTEWAYGDFINNQPPNYWSGQNENVIDVLRNAILQNPYIQDALSQSSLQDAYLNIVNQVIDSGKLLLSSNVKYENVLFDVSRRRMDVYTLLRMFPKPNGDEKPVKNVIFHAGASHTQHMQEFLVAQGYTIHRDTKTPYAANINDVCLKIDMMRDITFDS